MTIDLSTWNHWGNPRIFEEHADELGPVLVTVKYVIDPVKAPNFLNEIHRYQRIRRRDGATRWGIFYDTQAPNVYLETFSGPIPGQNIKGNITVSLWQTMNLKSGCSATRSKPTTVKPSSVAPVRQSLVH